MALLLTRMSGMPDHLAMSPSGRSSCGYRGVKVMEWQWIHYHSSTCPTEPPQVQSCQPALSSECSEMEHGMMGGALGGLPRGQGAGARVGKRQPSQRGALVGSINKSPS